MDEETQTPAKVWSGRFAASRRRRDDRVGDWQENVSKRIGGRGDKKSKGASVNKDAPLTKAKIALLYSQDPTIRLSTEDPNARGVVPEFAKKVNDTMQKERVGAAIEEELADVVNASGHSGVVVACEKRQEMRDVPSVDPMIAAMTGVVPEMIPTPFTTDIRYPVRRLSPACLLIPSEFSGSVYDQAPWLAYDGQMTWAQAQAEFGLSDEEKEDVLLADKRVGGDKYSLNTDSDKFRNEKVVNFTEGFYWRHFYDPLETDYSALNRIVVIEGREEVIDEPYQGQKRGQDGRIVGVKHNPIQILTLTYISDDCLPPSDSTISRGQVVELEESRGDMRKHRKHAIPTKWFNPNMVSASTRALLEKGTPEGYVPINGMGERALGVNAQTTFTQDKHELDRILEGEITEQWQVGPNQTGGFNSGERSAREAGIVQQNFSTRIGQERGKVERHVVAISEIIGALLALHGDSGIPVEYLGSITYSIRTDSTVLLDSQQRIEQIKEYVNMWGQSGYLNVKPLAEEHAELLGIDPAKVVVDPQPKPPEPVKMSISKAEDMASPLFLAELFATGQAFTPEHLAAALKMLEQAAMGATPVVPVKPAEEGKPPAEVATPGIRNADWQEQPRINKRDQDGGA